MSGGHWCHQNAEIEHIADQCDYIRDMLYKVSETAHINEEYLKKIIQEIRNIKKQQSEDCADVKYDKVNFDRS